MSEKKHYPIKSTVCIPYARLLEDIKTLDNHYMIRMIHLSQVSKGEEITTVYKSFIPKEANLAHIVQYLKKGSCIYASGSIDRIEVYHDKKTDKIYPSLNISLSAINFVPLPKNHTQTEESAPF